MIMKSTIFTKTEIAELERRLDGKKKNYKIWYRTKPKLFEIIFWFKKIDQIKNLVGCKEDERNNKKDLQQKKMLCR